jgi:steroid 5-alpha reductase family enzyme
LFLIAAPSVVAHIAVTSCGQEAPLNTYDLLATVMVLTFVVITTLADNEQYKFQTVKHRLKNAGKPLTGQYADGYKSSGLFAIVRKPNYAAEQGVWISFYCYSVAAFNGDRIFNWSLSGCVMLSLLFQGSGWLTEQITLGKYPKYAQYREEVPLYVPNPMTLLRMNGGSNEKTE